MQKQAVSRYECAGFCPVCELDQRFIAISDTPIPPEYEAHWFRGKLRCVTCNSNPRERAIALVLDKLRPNWRQLSIHECSPGGWALSPKLRRQCADYTPTQYDPSFPFGEMHESGKWRNENLEDQTFENEVFDIVLAQDVFEHLFHPGAAAREIARSLKQDGLCLLTVPIMNPWTQTLRRAEINNDEVIHLQPEMYHGNPVGDGRSLVTVDWSIAIGPYLSSHSGIPFTSLMIDDMRYAIRDHFNMVLVGMKGGLPDLGEPLPT